MSADTIAGLRDRFLGDDEELVTQALTELLRLGKTATPVLIEGLGHGNARTRRLSAEGLSELSDPAAADALFEATRDGSGEVRARAATALHKLKDPRALAALIATLNDYPDVLHNPYTASMYPLMSGGTEVLPLAVPLLASGNQVTRERAFLIVKAVASRHLGAQNWDGLWQSLGRYEPAGPQTERDDAARQWQAWVDQRRGA